MRGIPLILIALAPALLATQQQPAENTGLIVGQVVDAATGKPIAGAIVSTGGPRTPAPPGTVPLPPPRILTGADGRFVFRDLPRGRYSIYATKAGYAGGEFGRRRPNGPSQQLMLAEGERRGDVVVRMWKFGAIAGTVVDEAGEPVVGVMVRAFRRATAAGNRRFVVTQLASTDDRGMYRLGNLVPGEYLVAVGTREVQLAVTRESQTAVLTFSPDVRGSAVIQPGSPPLYGTGRGNPIPPPPSGGRLFIYPPTFSPTLSSIGEGAIAVASGEERPAVDLELQPVPTVRVSGNVIGSDDPAWSMIVRLHPAGFDEIAFDVDQDLPSAVAGRNGAFTFPAVPPGQYSVRAMTRSPGGPGRSRTETTMWAEVSIAVGREDVDGLALALQPGFRISGRFEFEGSAERPSAERLAQTPLVIEPMDRGGIGLPGNARPDANGQFTTAGFPGGRYFLRIAGSPTGWMFKSAMYDGRDISETPLDLQRDVTGVVVTFTDRWTGLSGMVRSAKGAPDDSAIVLVFPTDAQAWTNYGLNPRRVRSTRTTETGEYRISSLPPGSYYVVALPDEQAADWQDPKFLDALTGSATEVTIGDGEHKTQDLRTRDASGR